MKLFKSRCYNGGNKHDFQPFFHEIAPDLASLIEGFRGTIAAFDNLASRLTKRIYVKHVCTWCGKEVVDKSHANDIMQ